MEFLSSIHIGSSVWSGETWPQRVVLFQEFQEFGMQMYTQSKPLTTFGVLTKLNVITRMILVPPSMIDLSVFQIFALSNCELFEILKCCIPTRLV